MRTPAVEATALARSFAGVPVLAGIDLCVHGGEIIVLLGPNGAGKTTLLRVLATLLRPTAGRLALLGHDASTAPAAIRRRIGWLGHESACYPDLSAAENLAFYAELFEVIDAANRIANLLAWAGLGGAAHRPVREYSRGMQQRLALARAMLHHPRLLLLDEPFAGLDPAGADALIARLAALRAEGVAVLLTTHDLDRVASVATRTVVLDRGRIAWTRDGGVAEAAYRRMVGASS